MSDHVTVLHSPDQAVEGALIDVVAEREEQEVVGVAVEGLTSVPVSRS